MASTETVAQFGSYTLRLLNEQWLTIKQRFVQPDKPEGIENFLAEMGLG